MRFWSLRKEQAAYELSINEYVFMNSVNCYFYTSRVRLTEMEPRLSKTLFGVRCLAATTGRWRFADATMQCGEHTTVTKRITNSSITYLAAVPCAQQHSWSGYGAFSDRHVTKMGGRSNGLKTL